jgi:hypothetical protein
MPYKIVHGVKNGIVRYAVKTIASGKTHGWTTKEKAEAQLRLIKRATHEA